ncbi:LysM peptidoglycan-binding domain-containing protein [Nonomuraea sp. NPDC050556]|uniref:LysM peptidoglycan-binding domain-containing protein n=1 Tax=Nonomuraea sp. NPDC050556 TaxID=3364369 RepID=UPI003798B5DC
MMTTYGLRHPFLSRAFAALVLLALTAGIPAVLLAFFWPLHLPRLDELVAPAEPHVLKPLLLLVVWACWAVFAWSVLVELVTALRASRSRVRTPFQRLAAHLITTITVATTTPVAAARGAIPAATVAVVPATLPDPVAVAEPQMVEVSAAFKTYLVKPRDTLWDIAGRHLGDSNRYGEIAQLNAGRAMRDGQVFKDSDWLCPGWVLRMPTDATGLDEKRTLTGRVHTVEAGETLWEIADRHLGEGKRSKEIFKLNRGRVQPDGQRLVDPDEIRPGWRLILPEGATASATPDTPPPAEESAEPPQTVELPDGSIVAISFAAGIAVALASARLYMRRRRRIPSPAEPVGFALPEPEEPSVQMLEQVHRQAAPEPLDDYEVVKSSVSTQTPVSLPIGVGVALELSGLSLGLTGSGADATARAALVELLTQADQQRVQLLVPRADAVSLLGGGVLDRLDHLPGLKLVPSLDAAVDLLEEQFMARRRMLRDSDADDIPELRDQAPEQPLPALILVASLDERDHSYLGTLMGWAPQFGIGALLLGEWVAGTTCSVGAGSRVTEVTGPLAPQLVGASMLRLRPELAEVLVHKLACANGYVEEPDERDVDPEMPEPNPDEPRVRLGIVGPPVVEVDGQEIDLTRKTRAMELFVLLALHPKGLDREECCALMWPDVDEPHVGQRFHAALKELRLVLRTATGMEDKDAAFVEVSGRTYRIEARHVSVDYWTLHRSLAAARSSRSVEERMVALDSVAAICRGPLAKGLKYGWIDQDHRWPLTVACVKALLQLGGIHDAEGRAERALEVFEQASELDPDAETAAAAAIRLLLNLGRRDEARLRARQLVSSLKAIGAAPLEDTQAVLDLLRQSLAVRL